MLVLFHLDSKIKKIWTCVGPSLIDFEKVEKHKKTFTALSWLNSSRQICVLHKWHSRFLLSTDHGLTIYSKNNVSTKTVGKKYRLGFVQFNQKQLCLGSPAISAKVNKTASTLFLRKNILKNQWVLQARHLLQIWLIILLWFPWKCTCICFSFETRKYEFRLLSKHFCLQLLFPQRFSSLLIALFRGSVGGHMVETEVNIFETYACRFLENAFFLNFSRNFMGSFMGSFEETLTRKMHTTFFYVCL